MSDNDLNQVNMNNNNNYHTRSRIKRRNIASIMINSSRSRSQSANCDNYNLMCQLYKSINSREKFPIIKQSPDESDDHCGSWNNNKFSRRRRKRPPPPQMIMITRNSRRRVCNWQLLMQIVILLVLAICPRGVWSWSVERDLSASSSFYHQPAEEDYYSDVPAQHHIQNSLDPSPEAGFHEDVLPQFGKSPKVIEGTVGQTVILSCVVHNLGSKRVAWMRMRDLQILTHGPILFTSDVRMSSERPYGDHTRWGLIILDLRQEDSGKYVCSVNANPELKQEVELIVREQQQSDMPFVPAGRTVIEGPREEVVKTGTVVVFSCSARHQFSKQKTDETQIVVWLKDGHTIDKFETARGGVNVMTEWQLSSVSSKLTLIAASSSDNGVYSCTVPGSGTDKVTLFIDEAEAQANTHSGARSSYRRQTAAVPEIILLILICKYALHLMHL